MSVTTYRGRQTQPLPTARGQYDQNEESVMRTQVEQNFDDLWSALYREVRLTKRAISQDATLDYTIRVVEADATDGAVSLYLPPLAGAFYDITITKIDATGNTVTIYPDGTDQITGASLLILSAQWDSPRLVPGLTQWVFG